MGIQGWGRPDPIATAVPSRHTIPSHSPKKALDEMVPTVHITKMPVYQVCT